MRAGARTTTCAGSSETRAERGGVVVREMELGKCEGEGCAVDWQVYRWMGGWISLSLIGFVVVWLDEMKTMGCWFYFYYGVHVPSSSSSSSSAA